MRYGTVSTCRTNCSATGSVTAISTITSESIVTVQLNMGLGARHQ